MLINNLQPIVLIYIVRLLHNIANLRYQINNLRIRISLIRYSQSMGVLSLLMCTSSMFALFIVRQVEARIMFGCAMFFMVASLLLALREIHLSVRALNVEIDEIFDSEQ